MTLQQLNDVIAIAETGSFNRAADRLYIAQPSLTSAIKELEKELGVILFNRSGKGATLTAEGVNFLPYARSVIMQYQIFWMHMAKPVPEESDSRFPRSIIPSR